jgi:hypothetical protein
MQLMANRPAAASSAVTLFNPPFVWAGIRLQWK